MVDRDTKGNETSLVALLFEVVYPEIEEGVVLPVGFQQSINLQLAKYPYKRYNYFNKIVVFLILLCYTLLKLN